MVKQAVIRLAGWLRADAIAPRLWRGSLLVLSYHYFRADGGGAEQLVIEAGRFRRQVAWLSRHSRILRLSEALGTLAEGRGLPPRSVAVVVDDVGEDFVLHAWPVLREFDAPVTLAVCPGFMDREPGLPAALGLIHALLLERPEVEGAFCRVLGRDRLTYGQTWEVLAGKELPLLVRCLAAAGIPFPYEGPLLRSLRLPVAGWEALLPLLPSGLVDIASHSLTHPVIPMIGREWLLWELKESRRRIIERAGACSLFFYPGGVATTPRELGDALVREAGYAHAFAGHNDLVRPGAREAPLGRLAIDGREGDAGFRFRASGLPALARWYYR